MYSKYIRVPLALAFLIVNLPPCFAGYTASGSAASTENSTEASTKNSSESSRESTSPTDAANAAKSAEARTKPNPTEIRRNILKKAPNLKLKPISK